VDGNSFFSVQSVTRPVNAITLGVSMIVAGGYGVQRNFAFGSERSGIVFSAVMAVLAAIGCYLLRFHFLDDAFIHLRYAENFNELGKVSYDQAVTSYGTSSLGYMLVLSLASILIHGPILPKLVNLVIYGVLFWFVMCFFLRRHGTQQALAGTCLVLLVSPFALRWLTDGMESSLVVVTGVLLASKALDQRTPTWVLILLGAVAVLIRVEFLFVLGLASGGRALRAVGLSIRLAANHRSDWICWAAPVAGGLIGLGVIWMVFGHVLPDTAVAKQVRGADFNLFGTLADVGKAHVASSFLGIGGFLTWLVSFLTAARGDKTNDRIAVLGVNTGFLVFVALLAISHQSIQGIRYFFFLYSFLIAWNVGLISVALPKLRAWQTVLAVAVAGAWLAFDGYIVSNISGGRSQTYQTFAHSNLAALRGQPGVAWDIGFIGYFSNGTIWDVHGLVNGRGIAKLTDKQRLDTYAQHPLSFAFGDEPQLRDLRAAQPNAAWTCIFHADFPNFSGQPDRHWLIVASGLTQAILAANPQWPDESCKEMGPSIQVAPGDASAKAPK
jgi:hypothetical protein